MHAGRLFVYLFTIELFVDYLLRSPLPSLNPILLFLIGIVLVESDLI